MRIWSKEIYEDFPFLKERSCSGRLLNIIHAFEIKTIEEARKITKQQFLSWRQCGLITWNEFINLVNNYES